MRIVILFILVWMTMSSGCDIPSDFSNVRISSIQNENEDNFNNIILDGCVINKYWKYKNTQSEQSHRLFIDNNIKRVILRFEFLMEKVKKKEIININIDSIITNGNGDTSITMNNFDISQIEIIDAFINVECVNNTNNFFTVRTQISLYNSYSKKAYDFDIEMIKLCNCSIKDSLDLSHFILLIIIAGIIVASVLSYFTSKF